MIRVINVTLCYTAEIAVRKNENFKIMATLIMSMNCILVHLINVFTVTKAYGVQYGNLRNSYL